MKFENLIKIVFGIVFAIIIATIIVIGVISVFAIKGCNKIQEKGLKNVATEVWEGPASNAPSLNEQ